MEDIKKALDTIALKNYEGVVPDDLLVKACDAYKIKSDSFLDDYNYYVCVAKSLYDYINGVEPDKEICKAVLPGQTKVVDGVVYIYTATPGAQTQYDWRVFKGKKKIGKQVDDNKAKTNQQYVNDLFPSDLSTLKVIKRLGGSTGAQLVEDAKGNQYVMKKGTNTSSGHVKSEFLTNQLYEILGQKVPEFELYDDNGEAVMLSKFIPMTKVPTSKDYDSMAKGFVVDAFLANWDIYQNDNCLIDSAGRIIRVDNGGSLSYRAQGSKKPFGNIVDDFYSMQKYNPTVVANLSTQDYIDQINELLKKKDDIINFLEQSPWIQGTGYAETLSGRFDDFERIKKDLEAKQAIKSKTVLPRKLKSDADMYRDFSEDELDVLWKAQRGSDYNDKLMAQNSKSGWELLGKICEERGFNARPKVVDEAEYWNAVKQSKYPQLFRGLSEIGGHDAQFFDDDFKYNDNCFYGIYGIHGSGIYFHLNDGDKNKDSDKGKFKNSDAYKAARNYAGKTGIIVESALDPSSKVAFVPDLKKEILSLVTFDKAAVDAKQIEIDALNNQLKQQQDDLNNITDKTEKEIKTNMHWDEDTLVMSQLEIDNTDWGNLNDDGDPDYPSFEDFVEKKVFDWVKKNGGTVTEKGKGTDVYVFSLPNSKEKFMLSRYQWENNAIKRKNAFSNAYNYPLKRFQDWMMKEHYGVINKKISKELEHIGDKVTNLQSDIKVTKSELNIKTSEMADLKKTKDPNGDIISGIYESVRRGSKEAIGTYAALKGYDAIIEPHGNDGPHSFIIILNRSKVIVKK